MTDRELLDRYAAEADEGAFTELVARYAGLVRGACLRVLGDPHEAEDAVQAVFLLLARRRGRIGARESLASWLFYTALNVARTARRGLLRREHHEREGGRFLWAARDEQAAVAERAAARAALAPRLDEALARLPRAQREAIILHCLRGLPTAEAARELACPEPTLKTRLHRGLERLRQGLARAGVSLSAALLAALLAEEAQAAALPAAAAADLAAACAGQGFLTPRALELAQLAPPPGGLFGAAAALVAGIAAAGLAAACLLGALRPPAAHDARPPAPALAAGGGAKTGQAELPPVFLLPGRKESGRPPAQAETAPPAMTRAGATPAPTARPGRKGPPPILLHGVYGPDRGLVGERQVFNANTLDGEGGRVVNWRWKIGADMVQEGPLNHLVRAFATPGTYRVSVVVTDDDGLTDSAEKIILITDELRPVAALSAPATALVGQPVLLDASASRDPDGRIVNYRFFERRYTRDTPAARMTYTFTAPGRHVVGVTVTDDDGLSKSSSAVILVAAPPEVRN